MEIVKKNIWNLENDFDYLLSKKIWNALFGLTRNYRLPSTLIDEINVYRKKSIESLNIVLSDTNFSPNAELERINNEFWKSLKKKLNSSDFKKAMGISYLINSYIDYGIDNGFDNIKEKIILDDIVNTNWINLKHILISTQKEIEINFKNNLVNNLVIAIKTAGHDIENNNISNKIIMLVSDLKLFYTNICHISKSIINPHGFLAIDVVGDKIYITYQTKDKVASIYDITKNLTKSLSIGMNN